MFFSKLYYCKCARTEVKLDGNFPKDELSCKSSNYSCMNLNEQSSRKTSETGPNPYYKSAPGQTIVILESSWLILFKLLYETTKITLTTHVDLWGNIFLLFYNFGYKLKDRKT